MTHSRRVAIVGGGRVGRSLLALTRDAGVDARVWRRADGPVGGAAAAADLVICAVRDEAIAEVARALGDGGGTKVLLHCSGAQPAGEVLSEAAATWHVGTFHPLVAIADAQRGPDLIRRAYVALEGTARALEHGRWLAEKLNLRTLELPSEAMAAYHAAAVVASNYAVVLWDHAARLLGDATGHQAPEKVLAPLLEATVANFEALGAPAALTGPIRRGDAATVARHLTQLDKMGGSGTAQLYRELILPSIELARRSPQPPDDVDLERVAKCVKKRQP